MLQSDVHLPADWHLQTAKSLYQAAMTKGWDGNFDGLVYGLAPDGVFADAHKYFRVQCEAIAAAWRLFPVTQEEAYTLNYSRVWQYSWDHFVEHKCGTWFRILDRQGR